jgi:uncharacterized protein
VDRGAEFYTAPRVSVRLFASGGLGYGAEMRFAEADNSSGHLIGGYGADGILIDGRRYQSSLILTPRQIIEEWGPASAAELARAHLDAILALDPQVILLGTGARHVFPDPAVYAWALERRAGVEVMDTGAACRTYNLLMSEGRRVAAGLILD